MKRSMLCVALVTAGVLSSCASYSPTDFSRQTLSAQDGWAAVGGGVTGGAAAKDENVFVVSSRKELVAALKSAGDQPKIIKVKGTINLSADDSGRELFEKDYAVAPYNFDDYVKAYAPVVWNTKLDPKTKRPSRDLTGPQEEAREASSKRQEAQIRISIPSNTTLIGIGTDAKIIKGGLVIGNRTMSANAEPVVSNVIIRNIEFQDAFDYFPQWDPADSWKVDKSYPGCQDAYVDANIGPQKCPGGRWNSEYDSLWLSGAERVWVDHCTFNDGDRNDKKFPPNFPFPHNEVTQKIQHHDGMLDITLGSNFVTVSNNYFHDHDKSSLIGGSDSLDKVDGGKLNVTFRHNLYDNAGQRLPRVRFGQVHTYNNHYVGNAAGLDTPKFSAYENHTNAINAKNPGNIWRGAFGIGKNSAIFSENNVFDIKHGGADIAAVIQGGTKFLDQGSIVNGTSADIVKALNALDPKKQVSPDLGWKPAGYGAKVLPAAEVPAYVKANAGAGKLK
ncbi:polysaccharide lyase family 1 protein [Rhodoferax sp. BLA1]|uniref:pectate lyase family protein n=1 Tax=Rhodoferax sp. BLA1 TaxID=2576062 RepID=UPI0015D2F496|nr:PbsX family transcriptional regulator [Rhodoferax sp. BLA1]